MTAFTATAADVAPIIAAGLLILAAAWLVVRWHEAAARIDADVARIRRASEIAADTLARAEAARRQAEFQAHVESAFRAAMGEDGPAARVAGRIAANEAARIDGEWAEWNGGRS